MTDKALLLVDDELIILLSLKQELENYYGEKFIYETAPNAAAGLKLIEDLISDGIQVLLIISDWQMPGMKGDEFLIEVSQRYPGIKSLMVTGRADESAKKLVMEKAGTLKVLDKPWDFDDISDIIDSLSF